MACVHFDAPFARLDSESLHPLAKYKVFEGTAPPGHIRIESVVKALTTYGNEHLSEEQAHDLVSQVGGENPRHV